VASWLLLSGVCVQVRVELHVSYLQRTAPLQAVVDRLPEWGALSFEATTYTSYWEF
jgi:hypothetical protein